MVLCTSHVLCQGRLVDMNGRECPWGVGWVKLNMAMSYDPAFPLLHVSPTEMLGICLQIDVCTKVYSSSTRDSPNWKLPTYPSSGKWIDGSTQFERYERQIVVYTHIGILQVKEYERSTIPPSNTDESSV